MTSTGPLAAAAAINIRAPRSPAGCGRIVTRSCATNLRKESWVASGAHHTVTGPTADASAVIRVRSVSRSCRTAAACAPIVGMSRVLAWPGIGAFARIAIETGLLVDRGVAIALRKLGWIRAGEIGKPQPPHQKNSASDAVLPPATRRGRNFCSQAHWRANAPETCRKGYVLHESDRRETGRAFESRARDEDRLISCCNPGEAGPDVHHAGDQGKQEAILDPDIEPAPGAASTRKGF